MRIERAIPIEADLHELLGKPLPSTIEDIEKELVILNGLGTSPSELRDSVPNLDLRRGLIQRKGMLLKMNIIARAGLPINMAMGENTGPVLEFAGACLDVVEAIRKLLRKADALGISSIIRKILREELE